MEVDKYRYKKIIDIQYITWLLTHHSGYIEGQLTLVSNCPFAYIKIEM